MWNLQLLSSSHRRSWFAYVIIIVYILRFDIHLRWRNGDQPFTSATLSGIWPRGWGGRGLPPLLPWPGLLTVVRWVGERIFPLEDLLMVGCPSVGDFCKFLSKAKNIFRNQWYSNLRELTNAEKKKEIAYDGRHFFWKRVGLVIRGLLLIFRLQVLLKYPFYFKECWITS